MNGTYQAIRHLAETGESIALISREGAREIVAEVESVSALRRVLAQAKHETHVANKRAAGERDRAEHYARTCQALLDRVTSPTFLHPQHGAEAGQVQALTRRAEGANKEILRLSEIIVKLRVRIGEVAKCANRMLEGE